MTCYYVYCDMLYVTCYPSEPFVKHYEEGGVDKGVDEGHVQGHLGQGERSGTK